MSLPFPREKILATQPEEWSIESYKSEKKHDTPGDKLGDWKECLPSQCSHAAQNLHWIQPI